MQLNDAWCAKSMQCLTAECYMQDLAQQGKQVSSGVAGPRQFTSFPTRVHFTATEYAGHGCLVSFACAPAEPGLMI